MQQEQGRSDTELIDEIGTQQQSVDAYLDRAKPRFSRLTTVSIVASALAAAATAGPAMGGATFTTAVQGLLRLSEQATVWRVLCLVAALVSITAAVSANLVKVDDLATHVAAAEAARSHLRALRIRLGGGEGVAEARDELAVIVTSVPFVDSGHRRPKRWGNLLVPGAIAAVITFVSLHGLW